MSTGGNEPIDPKSLRSATVVRHRNGTSVVLSHRKADNTGWWVTVDGKPHGGLADMVLRDSRGDWTIETHSGREVAR